MIERSGELGASRPTHRQHRVTRENEMSGPTLVMMGPRQLGLSNLDKVLYPACGFHQGAGHRVLRQGRPRASAALQGSGGDAEALSRWSRRAGLVLKELPAASSTVVQN